MSATPGPYKVWMSKDGSHNVSNEAGAFVAECGYGDEGRDNAQMILRALQQFNHGTTSEKP